MPFSTRDSATYFITICCREKRPIFQTDRMAHLMLDVLLHYRGQQKYLLHEFVIMPDHLHALITPAETIEKCVQFIKGGFSFRAKKELGFNGEIWQQRFNDRRVRDALEYTRFRQYIHENPVRRGLCDVPNAYPWSPASERYALDDVPQGLKPANVMPANAGLKARSTTATTMI